MMKRIALFVLFLCALVLVLPTHKENPAKPSTTFSLAFLPPLVQTAHSQTPVSDVLLFSGQSNMQGNGITGMLGPTPVDHSAPFWEGFTHRSSDSLYEYPVPTAANSPGLAWYPNGFTFPDRWTTDTGHYIDVLYPERVVEVEAQVARYGPELAFIWKYRQAHPTTPLVVLKYAAGGTAINNWIPYDASTNPFGGSEYNVWVSLINQAKARLDGAGISYRFAAYLWYQGEAGAVQVDSSPSFATKTRQHLSLIRAITSTSMPCIIGRISDNMYRDNMVDPEIPANGANRAAIYAHLDTRRALQVAVGSDANNAWWSNDGLRAYGDVNPNETIHLWPYEYLTSGERAYTAFAALAGGGTAPTVTTTSLANGTTGVVYSQTLTATGDTPITWSVVSGTLSAWAGLNSSTGAITGTPNAVAVSSFTVRATNAAGTGDKALSITVTAPSISGGSLRGGAVRAGSIR